MNFKEYEDIACTTWNPPQRDPLLDISYLALGIMNEAGEVGGKIKKVVRGDYSLEEIQSALHAELGDVLWYLTILAHVCNSSLEEIARENNIKLTSRKLRNVIQGEGDTR